MQFFFHSLGEHGGILLQRECVSRGISGPNQCWISGEGQAVLQETAVSHASPVSQTSALKLRNCLSTPSYLSAKRSLYFLMRWRWEFWEILTSYGCSVESLPCEGLGVAFELK